MNKYRLVKFLNHIIDDLNLSKKYSITIICLLVNIFQLIQELLQTYCSCVDEVH